MLRINKLEACMLATATAILLALVASCGGKGASPTAPTSQQSGSSPATSAPTGNTPTGSSLNQVPAPQACSLLSIADVDSISGYAGGTATPTDLGDGSSSCHLISGKGEVTVELDAGAGVLPAMPGQKVVDLEGGAKGIASTQDILNQDWMNKVNLPNATVIMLLGGSAATLDPDKKIAQVTKADGSTATYAQMYEAFARAVAHNAAGGGQLPSGVVQSGDACAVLTPEDVKAEFSGFTIDPPDYQDSTFGGKQCIYRFQQDNPKAAGFATLLYVTKPKFDIDKQNFQAVSGVGDEAYMLPGGTMLDFRKGDKYVYMTCTVTALDNDVMQKLAPLMKEGLVQLAQKAAARIK